MLVFFENAKIGFFDEESSLFGKGNSADISVNAVQR
jgi:hypothetical protein